MCRGYPAEGGRKTTRPQSKFVGEGLARGACRRLLRNALGAATVMAVASGGGGEDVTAGRLGEGLAHGKVCLQVTLWLYDTINYTETLNRFCSIII